MIRATSDPLYRQVLARLDERLDPDAFEACVCDLLREGIPTLVPVRGGGDRGMDGAIADDKGEAYPLICTTSKDPLRNLSESLTSQLKKRFPRRRAVFATSRAVSPALRRNLEERARKRDFVLIQVIDREGLADRLYRDARWRRELLGLTGTPPALSLLPLGRRPSITTEPVGRDADLAWLRAAEGKSLLIGEPGSGKTFLLEHLVRQGWGFFLASDDQTEIANAIREQNPKVIVVDDAQIGLDRLKQLRRLRRQVGASFSIVASSWVHDRDRVAEALGELPSSAVRKLEPLSRDSIVEVFRRAGIETTDILMQRLVDQARNKPGLAATLAWLWRRGDWQDVLAGKALVQSLTLFFESVGKITCQVLAAFGLGGDRGMKKQAVQEFLDLRPADLQNLVWKLQDGGILTDEGDSALAVWPRELRSALLGKVFFCGANSLPYRDLLDQVEPPFFGKAVEALIVARGLGVGVPPSELQELVARSDSQGVWRQFTALGQPEAQWTLENYPGDLLDIAREALHAAPANTLSRLLHRAGEAESSALWAESVRPGKILGDWCLILSIPAAERLERRRRLAAAAARYLRQGGSYGVGTGALCLALSPGLRELSWDPGSGTRLTISRQLAPERLEIEGIWEENRHDVQQVDAAAWASLAKLLWQWSSPKILFHLAETPEDVVEAMRAFASRMLHDLGQALQGSPAATTVLRRHAEALGLELSLDPHPIFETLYSDPHYHPVHSPDEERSRALETLAEQWSKEPPKEVGRRLHGYASEAAKLGIRTPESLKEFLGHLAMKVDEPVICIDVFLDLGTGPGFVAPFLNRSANLEWPGWEQATGRCLNAEGYEEPALALLLTRTDPPPDLLEVALDRAVFFPNLVNTLTLCQQVPTASLVRLLRHPDPMTAFAAAVGEWKAHPQGTVRQEVLDVWRQSVLAATSDQVRRMGLLWHYLAQILKSDPELAFDWLRARIRAEELQTHLSDHVLWEALSTLDSGKRCCLLDEIALIPLQDELEISWLIRGLVRHDEILFERLLADDRLKNYHLLPLGEEPDFGASVPTPLGEERIKLALRALAAGYETQEVAAAFLPNPFPTTDVKYWEVWQGIFEALASHSRRELREAAREGLQIVAGRRGRAQENERRVELERLPEILRDPGTGPSQTGADRTIH